MNGEGNGAVAGWVTAVPRAKKVAVPWEPTRFSKKRSTPTTPCAPSWVAFVVEPLDGQPVPVGQRCRQHGVFDAEAVVLRGRSAEADAGAVSRRCGHTGTTGVAVPRPSDPPIMPPLAVELAAGGGQLHHRRPHDEPGRYEPTLRTAAASATERSLVQVDRWRVSG